MTQATSLNWIEIDKAASKALYRQITDQVREAILAGHLSACTRLPASRSLANDLHVSRITVTQAYDQLAAEGLLTSAPGSGTQVSDTVPEGAPDVPEDLFLQHINRLYGDLSTSAAFQPGIPAFDAFPSPHWARLLARVARRHDLSLLDYGHAGGFGPLRREICRYLMQSRGVSCDPEQIVIVTSVRAAIKVAAEVLLPIGAAVAVEDPGYKVARLVFERTRHTVRPIPMDRQGLQVAKLDATDCAAAYLTPAHHWPTGVALTPKRRQALVTWARARGAWLFEDDYDSEFRFESRPLRPLYARAPDRVIYIGTFSKTFAPSVRTAYLIAPPGTEIDFHQAVFLNAAEPALHVQAALSEFMAEGHFAVHVARMRKLYALRRQRLVAALETVFGDRLLIEVPPGGLQIIARHPDTLNTRELVHCAAQANLVLRDMASNCVHAPAPNAVHMGFAAIPEDQILPAVGRLERAIRHLL